jgi:uncharacterized protein
MEYRVFGKTGKKLSVITLGGMRYKHGWDNPREEIPEDTLQNCLECTQLAFENGINHIETAWGYKKSETVYGIVLNEILKKDRSSYFLMTKGDAKTAIEMRTMVERQLKDLKTSYFDFYGWHGINNKEQADIALKKGGPVHELHKLKEEGIIKHIGFSTHAPLDIIIRCIETGLFEFVNLHYYYFFQRNYGTIALAQSKGMGVFIISPNDKGGRLYDPPEKLRQLTAPATPIQWNARFCLQDPAIHTLSFGMTHPSHFDEMKGIFPTAIPMKEADREVLLNMDRQLLMDPYAHYQGYDLQNDPSGLNLPEILRLRRMWKCYDMLGFAKKRYNMFEPAHHWFPGAFATKEFIDKIDLSKVPGNIPIKEMVREVHEMFYDGNGK